MFGRRKKKTSVYFYHTCGLIDPPSESCLPPLPPQSGCFWKGIRFLRHAITVTELHPMTSHYFRSRASLLAERRRHVTWHPTVIHPFSIYADCKELFMGITWFFSLIVDPFVGAFATEYYTLNLPIIFKVICYFDIVNNFFLGYPDHRTRSVVLQCRKVVAHYCYTFFFFDLLSTFNVSQILVFFLGSNHYLIHLTSFLVYFRCVRIPNIVRVLQRIFRFFNLSDSIINLLITIILAFILMHWFACIIFHVPRLKYEYTGIKEELSWPVMEGIFVDLKNITVLEQYTSCMITIMCKFYGAGYGITQPAKNWDLILHSIFACVGIMFYGFAIVMVIGIMESMNTSDQKFDEILKHLQVYSREKKLAPWQAERLVKFYRTRFHKRYFRESSILGTLSDHLRQEIFLHTCTRLITNDDFFKNASKAFIGSVIANLKLQVYLTNDVIALAGTNADHIYFILYGTVATISQTGVEIKHFKDGEHFGSAEMMLPYTDGVRLCSFIALEVCEIYEMHRDSVNMLEMNFPLYMSKLQEYNEDKLGLFLRKMRGSAVEGEEKVVPKFKDLHPRDGSFSAF